MTENVAGFRGEPTAQDTGLALVRGRLGDAARCARNGEAQRTREICAELFLDHLTCFDTDRDLLVQLVEALLHARAHGLLGRVLRATTGCSIRLLPTDAADLPVPPASTGAGGMRDLVARPVASADAVRERSEHLVDWAYHGVAPPRVDA